jgi:hypothetical protein
MELFSQNQARAVQQVNWNLQGDGARSAMSEPCIKGCSSAGRASVSKTEGRGFESPRPCQSLKSEV